MATFFAMLALLALAALLLGLFKPHIALFWNKKPNRVKNLIAYLGLFFVLLLVSGALQEGVNESKEVKDAASRSEKDVLKNDLSNIHGSINKVDLWKTQKGTYRASIFFVENTAISPSSLMFMLSQDMVDIARNIYDTEAGKKLEEIIFFAHTEKNNLLMKLWYDATKLQEINLNNTPSQKFLSLAKKLEVRPDGKRVALAFCRNADNPGMVRQFCRKVLQ